MSRRTLFIAIAVGAFAAVAIGVIAGAIAHKNESVAISSGPEKISQSDYDELWFARARGSGDLIVPDRPDYKDCAAKLLIFSQKKGGPAGTEKQRVVACRARARAVTQATTDSIITQMWIKREAARVGVTVSNSEVNQYFADEAKTAQDRAQFNQAVAQSGGVSASKEKIRKGLIEEKLILHKGYGGGAPSAKRLREVYKTYRKDYPGESFEEARASLVKRLNAGQVMLNRSQLNNALKKRYRASTFCQKSLASDLCVVK